MQQASEKELSYADLLEEPTRRGIEAKCERLTAMMTAMALPIREDA